MNFLVNFGLRSQETKDYLRRNTSGQIKAALAEIHDTRLHDFELDQVVLSHLAALLEAVAIALLKEINVSFIAL